ncbi:ERV/ALR sulfhydryl oxidase domain-containing protein [Schizothecium vesticola]|uniref:Sulfhydryl oxidase n=1 Tax=Schizothecium vesticola TaxID=314040 RepID=A0AA40K9I2_9PEZI|nr:ERV/ALR sulfhydryl oxidase domain-containing protein [Schizothecium vesticola]
MTPNPDNTRPTSEQQQPADTTTTTTASEPPKKFPKGIVLGKDGKPCRSCTSFAAWASQTKKSTTTTPKPPTAVPKDCPPDVETLGRSGWTLLHSIAATYPTQPTSAEQSDVRSFMRLFARLYPCWTCGEDFTRYMASGNKPVRTGSRDELGTWLCEAHNEVNRKLGKEVFDCARWEERWRTGWKDGRCD